MSTRLVQFTVPDRIASELPEDPAQRREILELGLRSLRIRKALDEYQRGAGSLAHAANQAGVTLREMIPLAFAHGLTPKVAPALSDSSLCLEQAAEL